MNYRSRELKEAVVFVCRYKCVYSFEYSYNPMGTLIRIRNVCLSYWKRGVVSFFQDIEWKKVELYNFFGNYPKNNVKLCGFSESYSLKNGEMVIPETHVEKMELYRFFVFIQDNECTLVISVIIT